MTAGLPPHDLEAEEVALGMILDADAIDRVSEFVEPADFYADQNRALFEAALAVRGAGMSVSPTSVAAWLRDRERLPGVGGAARIAELASETPYVSDVESVARRIRDKARVRRLQAECHRIAAEAYGDVGEFSAWINAAEARIHAVAQDRDEASMKRVNDVLRRVFERVQNPEKQEGLRTGLIDLDRLLGPLCRGQLIVIGALSGIGKSALAVNVSTYASVRQQVASVLFSCEMEDEELVLRALFAEARVDTSKISRMERLTDTEWQSLTAAANDIGRAPIFIDDRPNISPGQIRGAVRRLQSRLKPSGTEMGLVVVDYLQLLDGKAGLPKGASRENEVAEIARALKVLAKEAQVPVLALAQLNADSEKGSGRKPRLSDLRESKALGQNADKVVLIHNPAAIERAEAYRNGDDARAPLEAEQVDLIVAKNRGGRTGTVVALFWPSYTLFANAERHG